MTVKYVLPALILVTAAALTLTLLSAQDYAAAAVVVGVGLGWLFLEVRGEHNLGTICFLMFLMLASAASLNQAPSPIILLGFTSNLTTWDLSRFRARIAGETDHEAIALLESRHLRKLAITACAGFLVALVPVFIQISISFVILLFIVLLTILALRHAMLSLHNDPAGRL